ncbi:hypothetical protein CJ030_MR3G019439 [Morella rubra]|uniref:Uncharacterized protein n=1 Tax=Morella rubra TaxID=262757 RepID=A0A6A1W490_9ROSI|nr:hypothetical protein CJ030_MR3G019439 [Morella rubra]
MGKSREEGKTRGEGSLVFSPPKHFTPKPPPPPFCHTLHTPFPHSFALTTEEKKEKKKREEEEAEEKKEKKREEEEAEEKKKKKREEEEPEEKKEKKREEEEGEEERREEGKTKISQATSASNCSDLDVLIEGWGHRWITPNSKDYVNISDLSDSDDYQCDLKRKTYTKIEVYSEILVKKSGYVRRLGCAVKPPPSSNLPTQSSDLQDQLEKARDEIEAMRAAREKDLHEFVKKQTEMEATLQDHHEEQQVEQEPIQLEQEEHMKKEQECNRVEHEECMQKEQERLWAEISEGAGEENVLCNGEENERHVKATIQPMVATHKGKDIMVLFVVGFKATPQANLVDEVDEETKRPFLGIGTMWWDNVLSRIDDHYEVDVNANDEVKVGEEAADIGEASVNEGGPPIDVSGSFFNIGGPSFEVGGHSFDASPSFEVGGLFDDTDSEHVDAEHVT